jgi:hypothetical protein
MYVLYNNGSQSWDCQAENIFFINANNVCCVANVFIIEWGVVIRSQEYSTSMYIGTKGTYIFKLLRYLYDLNQINLSQQKNEYESFIFNSSKYLHCLHLVSCSTTVSTRATFLNRDPWFARILSGLPPFSVRNKSRSNTMMFYNFLLMWLKTFHRTTASTANLLHDHSEKVFNDVIFSFLPAMRYRQRLLSVTCFVFVFCCKAR